KVVILVDDFARPTPKMELLGCVIRHLEKLGIKYEQIDVLFALGTHRPLSEAEVEEALGKEFLGKIRYSHHDSRSDKLISIGRLKTGGEVKINPLLIEADFRIGIGSIVPHPFSGFGGGPKIIMPGVANFEAIREHHLAHMIAPGTSLGNLQKNLFFEEICEVARKAKLDFIVNAVYNSREEVKAVVSGHFIKAHRHGVDLTSKELMVKIDQVADVSIASSFPYDEGPQIMKPLGTPAMMTKPGGTVILTARVRGGKLPDILFQSFDTAFQLAEGDPKRLVLDYLREGKLIAPNAPMDFNCALKHTLLYLSRVKVILVSQDVDRNQTARLGFGYASSLEEAIERVKEEIPRGDVHILPAAGLVIPVMKEEVRFH
ncbi:MAG: DUF2088 domain-containing protein, partial [Deltaproteobacteria bacterium]